MTGKYILVTIILVLIFSIIVAYKFAKRKALTCPDCGERKCKKTGRKKEIERKRRALLASGVPFYDYEYKCPSCGTHFWSTIESIWKL